MPLHLALCSLLLCAAASPPADPPARVDATGDPLPVGARARFGTVRLRHGYMLRQAVFAPDGKTVATLGGTPAHGIVLWDAATGRELRVFARLQYDSQIAFTPDGTRLVASGRPLSVFDMASGKELFNRDRDENCLAVSADGKFLAAGDSQGTVTVLDLRTGVERHRLTGKEKEVHAVAFSPDGRLLASAGPDKAVRLWDPETGAAVRVLEGHPDAATALAFAPDGKTLVAGGEDGTLLSWDPRTGGLARRVGKSPGPVSALAYAPDGKTLVSGSREWRAVLVWDPAAGRELRRWEAHGGWVTSVAFAPDGKTLMTAGIWDNAPRFWDPETGKELRSAAGHRGQVEALRFSPDGNGLTTYGRDARVLRWDLATGRARTLFAGPVPGAPVGGALSPDGRTLAAGFFADQTLRLIDVESGRARVLHAGKDRVLGLAFAPDGRTLVSGGGDKVLRFWDVAGGKEVRRVEKLREVPDDFAFTPDGKTLAAGGRWRGGVGAGATLWDVEGGRETRYLPGNVFACAVAFSPDGRLLAAADNYLGKTLRLWDAPSGKQRWQAEIPGERGLATLAFSPDGALLAAGVREGDGSVRLYEVATGGEAARLDGRQGGGACLMFSPDGRTLATGGSDSTILLWDVPGGASNATPPTARELVAHWAALGGGDAAAAYRAVGALAASPRESVPFLRERLRPAAAVEPGRAERLAADLDADYFRTRERAAADLEHLGEPAAPALRKYLDGRPPAEARRRAERLLARLESGPEILRARRWVQALEYAGTAEARRLLGELADGLPGARLTREARAALGRLAARP